jgi:hypothetical protein
MSHNINRTRIEKLEARNEDLAAKLLDLQQQLAVNARYIEKTNAELSYALRANIDLMDKIVWPPVSVTPPGDPRYEQGYKAGKKAGKLAGFRDGWRKAVDTIAQWYEVQGRYVAGISQEKRGEAIRIRHTAVPFDPYTP